MFSWDPVYFFRAGGGANAQDRLAEEGLQRGREERCRAVEGAVALRPQGITRNLPWPEAAEPKLLALLDSAGFRA